MTRVTHFDRLELRLDKSSVTRVPGGGVHVDGIAARTGLYTYRDDKGDPFIELVPAETLFAQASLDSLAGKPFTIRHPDGLVTPENFQEVTHGSVVKAWQASDSEMGVRVFIGSQRGLDALEAGMVELSPGYEVDVSDTPGNTAHGHHDGVQHDRVYNHLSGLWAGEARGGSQMRLQLDGAACAPEGTRVQCSQHMRRDGVDANERETMKVKITHKDGRAVNVDAALVSGLRFVALDAAGQTQAKADQIETAMVSVTREGEEPIELVLPAAMVEAMLAGIGGEVAAAPAAPEGMGEEEMVEQVESRDASAEDREDGVTLAQIDALITRRLAAKSKKDAHEAALGARISRDAAVLLPDAGGDMWQVASDALARALPDEADTWAARVAKCRKGDAMEMGAVLERLRVLADAAREQPAPHFDGLRAPRRNSGRQPWLSGQPNKPAEVN